MRKTSLLVFAAITFLAVSFVLHGQAYADEGEAPVTTFKNPDGTTIPPADRVVTGSAKLERRDSGITIEVETTGLDPGAAYTNWWVIDNNPGGERSVLYATGRVADAFGNATFRAFLPVGLVRLNRTVGGRERHRVGPGLQDPRKAEITYIIRNHGPAVASNANLIEQLGTVNGFCSVPLGMAFVCFDQQVIVFPLP